MLLDLISFPNEPTYEDKTIKIYMVWDKDVKVEKYEFKDGTKTTYLICKAGIPLVNFNK